VATPWHRQSSDSGDDDLGTGRSTVDKTAAVAPDAASYCRAVAADGAGLLDAARQGPAAPVPPCPGWDVTELVRHVARVHRWVTALLAADPTTGATFPKDAPPAWAGLAPWYEEGLAALVASLRATDPAHRVWNWWAGGPAPAGFWHRRMAHETAVHRVDAEIAVIGVATPIDGDLAADGIEEYLTLADRALSEHPLEGLSGRLGLRAEDADLVLTIAMADDGVATEDGLDAAEAVVCGPASSLLLWLVRRLPLGALEVTGDEGVARRWQRVTF
jgi:uncharacterized protein (TIGR03083 family)